MDAICTTILEDLISWIIYLGFYPSFNYNLVFTCKKLFSKQERTRVLSFTFAGSTIPNSWASPLAAATGTVGELVLFKGSYISRLYGIYTIQ